MCPKPQQPTNWPTIHDLTISREWHLKKIKLKGNVEFETSTPILPQLSVVALSYTMILNTSHVNFLPTRFFKIKICFMYLPNFIKSKPLILSLMQQSWCMYNIMGHVPPKIKLSVLFNLHCITLEGISKFQYHHLTDVIECFLHI